MVTERRCVLASVCAIQSSIFSRRIADARVPCLINLPCMCCRVKTPGGSWIKKTSGCLRIRQEHNHGSSICDGHYQYDTNIKYDACVATIILRYLYKYCSCMI